MRGWGLTRYHDGVNEHVSPPAAIKSRRYRDRKRAGLRQVRLWLPDVRSPAFEAGARRQARAVAASTAEEDAMRFLEAMQAEQDVGDA